MTIFEFLSDHRWPFLRFLKSHHRPLQATHVIFRLMTGTGKAETLIKLPSCPCLNMSAHNMSLHDRDCWFVSLFRCVNGWMPPLVWAWMQGAGIDKSLALERKIESRKRNFSLDLENLIVSISLSTLDFREWQETILFLLSIFESGKTNFSFYSRFSRVARQNSLSTLDFSLDFWEFKSRVQHHKSVSLREGCKKNYVKSLVFCL